MKRPKRGSGERSNWYSGSKFTNWTRFDPYWSEAKACSVGGRAAAVVDPPGLSPPIPIYSRLPHARFCHPCTPDDIRSVLLSCPVEFLGGLEAVFLLSGSTKQDRSLKLFRYGCYSGNRIYLHAYPELVMEQHHDTPPQPHVRREYERCGARISKIAGRWVVRFDESSLRRFYLFDVLLHELGHHVDERTFSRPHKAAERYAEWFAAEQARQLSAPGAG